MKPKQVCARCAKPSEIDCYAYLLCLECWSKWLDEIELPPKPARWRPGEIHEQAAWNKRALEWAAK